MRDSLGTLCLWGIRDDFGALSLPKSTHCRTQTTFVAVPNPKPPFQHNKKTSRWDIFLLWRMVRDSNPRMGCPISGFQDRRIRPLCQPSLTLYLFMTIALYIFRPEMSIFIFCASHGKKQPRLAKTRRLTIIAPWSIPTKSKNQFAHLVAEIVHRKS